MDRVQIKAVPRSVHGKGPARRERAAGRIPAVVYRGGKESVSFSFDAKDFDKVLALGRNRLYQLDLSELNQASTLALLKEVQRHPTLPGFLHVDFLAVEPTSEVAVDVPIELQGTPEGVKLGGKLHRHLRKAKLLCRADGIPRTIDVDITSMMPGETKLLSRVTPPAGTRLAFRHDLPVVSVTTIAAAMERAEGEGAGAAGESAAAE